MDRKSSRSRERKRELKLDATKGWEEDPTNALPIYLRDEIPDTVDVSLGNGAAPQMPTGMEKEEESERHLQRAICQGSAIPTPEIEDVTDYTKLYPETIMQMPQKHFHMYMHPFSVEEDSPDYDMDSEDEVWVNSQATRLKLTPDKFEGMMDRLEKGSGPTVVTLQEAKALIKEDDDLIIAVYDYWLNKRLKTQHPLIPQVQTEARHGVTNHKSYIAFRSRTEKMRTRTRQERRNDESSYQRMFNLKRDLTRALTLLEMAKRGEQSKRELLNLSIEEFEKTYQAGDYSGQIVSEALQQRPALPAPSPVLPPETTAAAGSSRSALLPGSSGLPGYGMDMEINMSEEDSAAQTSPEEYDEDEGPYAFRPKPGVVYQSPQETASWPWCAEDDTGIGDKRLRYFPTSLPTESGYRFVGFARRRFGRGGRMVLDRINCRSGVELWRSLVSESMESSRTSGNSANQSYPNNSQGVNTEVNVDVATEASSNPPLVAHFQSPQLGCIHYRPKTPETMSDNDPMFDSMPRAPLELESSLEDQEENSSTNLSSLQSESSFIGVVVSGGDPPLVFNAHGLQTNPSLSGDPLPMHTDCPSDSLLNEASADMVNSSLFMEMASAGSEFGFNADGDAWFTSLDVPDNILSGDGEDSSFPSTSSAVPSTSSSSSDTPGGG